MNPAAIQHIRAAREALLEAYPELADDADFLADVIEGQTDAAAIMAKLIEGRNDDEANAALLAAIQRDDEYNKLEEIRLNLVDCLLIYANNTLRDDPVWKAMIRPYHTAAGASLETCHG